MASSWQEGDSDERGDRSYSSRGRDYSDRRDRDSYGGGGSRGDSYSSRGRGSGGRRSGGRGRGTGRGGGMRPGDWLCPDCGYRNFASKTECNSCAAPRPENLPRYDEQQQREAKPGDWDCEGCGAHNFARRTQCFKCGEPAPEEVLARQAAARAEQREDGDWDCPECGQQGNWGSREFCRACNAPNPNPVTPRRQARGGDRDGEYSARGYDRGGQGRERQEYAPREQREYVAKEGDWTCAECGDVNYAFRTECRKCHAPKA